MLSLSVKPEGQAITYPPTLFPRSLDLSPYVNVWGQIGLAVCTSTPCSSPAVTVLSVTFDSLAAYAFARLRFPGKELLFWLSWSPLWCRWPSLSCRCSSRCTSSIGSTPTRADRAPRRQRLRYFPAQTVLQHFAVRAGRRRRVDGPASSSYTVVSSSVSAARDCRPSRLYVLVQLEQLSLALIITTTSNMRTLPSGLVLFTGEHEVIYNLMSAAAVLAMAPLVVLFFFLQRYFVRGIALSGLR